MDDDSGAGSQPLTRSISQQSAASLSSVRSHRSRTGGRSRRLPSHTSSSRASSVATSECDKSLTSFPSFSPDGLRDGMHGFFDFEGPEGDEGRGDRETTPTVRRRGTGTTMGSLSEGSQGKSRDLSVKRVIERSITGSSAAVGTTTTTVSSQNARSALFDDSSIVGTQNIPGAMHRADDAHIERMIKRHGAVGLVRQVAEDLAKRDVQIATLRRRFDERERALRKICLECGLSNLDLETRLRAVESDIRENRGKKTRTRTADGETGGVEDMMSDAMGEDSFAYSLFTGGDDGDGTIRASGLMAGKSGEDGKGTLKGWKDYLWGANASKKNSREGSVDGDLRFPTVVRTQSATDRRPGLQDDLFTPPETGSLRGSSRASSVSVNPGGRKPSFASMALRLVAGGAITSRESSENRGRVSSGAHADGVRASSNSSGLVSQSSRVVSSSHAGPKALMAMRRTAPTTAAAPATTRTNPQERWDTMAGTPPNSSAARQESYGPVEMDAILPPEDQPPTLTHIYNNYGNSEFLTDRFGFIYDQRRKKRQRDASQMAKQLKQGARTEMLTNGRTRMSPNMLDETPSPSPRSEVFGDTRPETPSSTEERADEAKPKRWQDYLKIATFPTELLSHTPSMSIQSIQVLEGVEPIEPVESQERPKSPAAITPDERGFLPSASTTSAVASDTVPPRMTPIAEAEPKAGAKLVNEDIEPVKLLLEQLSEVHDSLQRDKTVRWNDFLRKVRAERKREGDAAMAAAVAAAEARFEQPAVMLPEAKLQDGEFIGISGLGNKGKVGRAKWNEFKALVLGGIPVAYRSKVWAECSGATTLRVPGYYDDLVSQPSSEDDAQVVSQIQMDIHRTLTDNIFFRKGPGVHKLKEVLIAYSRRNKEVGYCQGMNLVTANLLLITPSAEDAFWILASIVENILPTGYYDHSLLASRADQQVLREYVRKVLPKLSGHLDDLGIELEALTFQWFLSVFTDCLSAEALFRVWDVVLCLGGGDTDPLPPPTTTGINIPVPNLNGSPNPDSSPTTPTPDGASDSGTNRGTFLFQVALALLKLNEGMLMGCATAAEVYSYLNHAMTNHAISIDGLIQASEGLRRVVRDGDVRGLRAASIRGEREVTRRRAESLSLGVGKKRVLEGRIAEEEEVSWTSPTRRKVALKESRRSVEFPGVGVLKRDTAWITRVFFLGLWKNGRDCVDGYSVLVHKTGLISILHDTPTRTARCTQTGQGMDED